MRFERLCDAALERFPDSLGVAWSFVDASPDGHVPDLGPHGVHGRLVHRPTLGVTGPHWTGHELDPRRAPRQYDAVHFHVDDLDDARWPAAFEWRVPDELPGGVYAARIRADEAADCVPVVVGGRRAGVRVCVALPTFTYLAYGNNANDPCGAGHLLRDVRRQPHDFSLYEPHADGSERCYASLRRPLVDLRPGHRYPGLGAPVHLPGDLDLLDWLEHLDVAYDIVTDHVLHVHGRASLDGYDVVLTGSHPEYVSGAILGSLEEYVARGGRLMYLGGNGFYWVTEPVGEDLHALEVRRGHSGTRPWHSEPGETHLATTGEPGGLWRHRGRSPNRLLGVGFAAHGCDPVARGYSRTAASYSPEVSFVFRGVNETEAIGAHGPSATGAAGIEVDRADVRLGTPPDTVVLATARLRSDRYHVAIEDLEAITSGTSGIDNDDVRADMAIRVLPNGGAVFSVGSIAWTSCLPHNGYDNDAARVTSNVLNAFLHDRLAPTAG
jgi:N,N-dimethylformamidase